MEKVAAITFFGSAVRSNFINMRFRFSTSKFFFRPYFFLLLPVFFVLHGLLENLFIINYTDAFLLLLFYIGIETFLFFIFRVVYKNNFKAAFAVFISFAIYFFFGAIHDCLKYFVPEFFSRYSFLLVFLLLAYLFSLLGLKRRAFGKKPAVYLNVLFIFLIFMDLMLIIYQVEKNKSKQFAIVETTPLAKPNVYLLVLDGYAGTKQLQYTFHFHNDVFLDSLSALGFSVMKNSTSNYSSTPFSIASLLSMSFHKELKNFEYTDENLNYCYKKITQSNVVSGFTSLGYQFINYSIFDIKGETSLINKTFLKSGTDLITAQTLWSRIKRDLYDNFIIKHMRGSSLYKDFMMKDYYNNELLYDRTLRQTVVSYSKPKFVYTHLLMPHFPYYFNANGDLNGMDKISPENMDNEHLYLEYLQYANGKILTLLNKIIREDKNSIILLLSDHGYRYAGDGNLIFSNLSAIYDNQLRIKDYAASVTNVNVFRVLFNNLFQTQLQLLPNKSFK